jgi:uncharacterized protein (TIGR03437 family)
VLFLREQGGSVRALILLAVVLTPTIGYGQAPVITAAVNAASFAQDQPLSPGALVSIFGTGLAASTTTASTVPLPDSIEGVSVTFSGMIAPLQFVSLGQINLQVPWSIQPGTTDIVVTLNGIRSAAFRAQVGAVSPGIFTIPSGPHQAVAFDSRGVVAAPLGSIPGIPTYPASVGSTIMLFATGLGLVTPASSDGADSIDQTRDTIATPTVLINGFPAHVTFSGLSPEFVGVNQINVVVPEAAWGKDGGGGEVPIQIELGGIRTSGDVTIRVLGKWDY